MKKILVVDDHEDIRKLIRITLGRGFEVLDAEDGESAMALVRSERPDLVVLDVMMPGALDGLKVLDLIRADDTLKATRVVMVTARGQSKDRDEGLARGADAYVIKPFSPLQLVAQIRQLLAGTD